MNLAAYTDTIRRWASDDRRTGTLPAADGIGEVGLGETEAGRRLAVRFALQLEDNRIKTVRYQVFGCGFTMAACAAAADLAEGHTLREVGSITPAWVDAVLAGLPPEREYCAQLAVEALQAAVESADGSRQPVRSSLAANDEHTPRLTANDPVYRQLLDSAAPAGVPPEDRHLFACLLAVAAGENLSPAVALGLSADELRDLLDLYFPAAAWKHDLHVPPGFVPEEHCTATALSTVNPELLLLIFDYLPHDDEGWTPAPALWLARILVARAAIPGHLWRAMGLFARPELTAAITRHLPALAAANHRGMRWKRFLFKQRCDRNGGTLCKAPDCGTCSDYALCFAEEP